MQIAFEFSHQFHDPVLFARFSEGFAALVERFISGVPAPVRTENAVLTPRVPVVPAVALPAAQPASYSAPANAIADADSAPTAVEPAQQSVPSQTRAEAAAERAAEFDALPTDEKPKRRRRTKAEMEAARATSSVSQTPAAVSVPPPSAPASIDPPPAGDKPDDQYTIEDMRAAFTAVFAHPDAEARILQLLPAYGVGKVRDAKPEHYGPLTRAFEALRRELMPSSDE